MRILKKVQTRIDFDFDRVYTIFNLKVSVSGKGSPPHNRRTHHASATPRHASVKLSAEQLEARDVPAIILTETTTFTDSWTGGTAQVTVTVDDVDDDGVVYRWNYHLENVSVNYAVAGDPPVGIGKLDAGAAAVLVTTDTLFAPSGWGAYSGTLNGNPNHIWWLGGGSGLLPGQSTDFGFDTDVVDIVDVPAQLADPGFAFTVGGLVKAPGEKPTIKIDRFPTPDVANEWQDPGVRIHINDNFDESQETATDRIADYLPNPANGLHQIKPDDADLQAAKLKLNMATTNWTLTWTVTPKVKVWYLDWLAPVANQWKQVSGTMEFTGVAVPAAIDLRIEGVELGSGTVLAEVKNRDTNTSANNWITVNVFTGLRFTGDLAQEAITQLKDATASKLLAVDGYVYRESESKTADDWQTVARTGLNPALRHKQLTTIEAVESKDVVIGNFQFGKIDPRDIAKVGETIHKLDINKQGAARKRIQSALLMHEVWEQHIKQTQGYWNDYAPPHKAACFFDAKMIANVNERVLPDPEAADIGNGIRRLTITYKDGGTLRIMTIDFNLTEKQNIEGVGMTYPDPG